MELRELTAPFEKKKVITYKSDQNTVVAKNIALQHIVGPAYNEADRKDKLGQSYCHIYVYYDALQVGIDMGCIVHPGLRTVEAILDGVKAQELTTLEDAIASLDRSVEEKRFISNAWIEFARYAAPDRVDVYSKARQDYLDDRERKAAERRAAWEAQEAAQRQEQNEKARAMIGKALDIIQRGGKLENNSIVICNSAHDGSEYKIVNHLARQYGVDIPLKVQGWINRRLTSVTIRDGRAVSVTCYGKGSKTFWGYMNKLIEAVGRGSSQEASENKMKAHCSAHTKQWPQIYGDRQRCLSPYTF